MVAVGMPPPSSHVGPYRIERRLGAGGMGVVYLGRDETSGTLAAVKLIRPEHAANAKFRARLRREVSAARRVPRFCTAPVLAADVDANPPWVATEYIDGPTLDAALLERGLMAGAALETFAVGVAVALHAIHQQGVVHRDLKPSNIVLSSLGPRVIDFGIARVEGADTPLTRTGAVVGTPTYMAPEQLRGEPATAAVDVFAWAGLVTYAATGRPPFGAGDAALFSILQDPPDLTGLAGPVRNLVAAALEKNPAARPSSADLVARLSTTVPEAATRVLAAATTAPAVPAIRPYRRTRRRLVLAGALVTAVAVAVAASAVALARGDGGGGAAGPDEAQSRRLAAESLALGETDQRRSMELALEAWAAAPTAEARGALLSAHPLPYAGRLGTEPGGHSVAVDPAGTMIAIGHADGTVQLWDAQTRQPLSEPLVGHGSPVYGAEFSPDGTLLATASIEADEDGGPAGVRVWEVPSGRLLRSLPGVGAVAWLPAGETLVAIAFRDDGEGGEERLLVMWDPRTGEEVATIPTGELVAAIAVSPDGEWIAGGRAGGTVGVWRVTDGEPVTEISGYAEQGLVYVAFAPSGELATAGAEGRIELWQLPDAAEPQQITAGGDRTSGRLRFTPEGYLLAAGGGSAIQWFDPATDKGGQLIGFEGTPFDIATSADGKLVAATGTSSPTILWRRATFWLRHPDSVMDVAFAPPGDRVATVDASGAVRTWDTGTRSVTTTGAHADQGYDVAYGPDGTLVSTAIDGTVRIASPGGDERAVLSLADGYEPRDLALSPDGTLLAVAASPTLLEDGQHVIYVWDTGTLQPHPILGLGDAGAYALTFTPDGSTLLAAAHTTGDATSESARTELRAWRTDGLVAEQPVDLGPGHITDLKVSPDGGTLAVAGEDRTVRLRGLAADQPGREIAEHPVTVREVAFSPDGTMLATITVDEGLVRLWDVETGTLLAGLVGHTLAPNGIEFSPDGRTLASGSADGYVGLWAVHPEDAIGRLCQVVTHPLCTAD